MSYDPIGKDMIREPACPVTGEISRRGRFLYREGMTPLEAVSRAGDLARFANRRV